MDEVWKQKRLDELWSAYVHGTLSPPHFSLISDRAKKPSKFSLPLGWCTIKQLSPKMLNRRQKRRGKVA